VTRASGRGCEPCAGRSPRSRTQEGDSLIEVLVAAFIGILVIGALAFSFVSGNDASLAAQRQDELVAAAQQQMQSIHALVKGQGFGALALSALPSPASAANVRYDAATPLDPRSFVTSCGATPAYQIENNYDDTSEGLVSSLPVISPCTSAGIEPLITGGQVAPQPAPVTEGSMTVDLYDFVTQTSVGCNSALGDGSCAGDARRVIVAAVDAGAASRCASSSAANRCAIGAFAPVYLTTIFTNPTPSNAPNSSVGITLGAQLG
jgi:type II secretory pathway pseudopilin PulG